MSSENTSTNPSEAPSNASGSTPPQKTPRVADYVGRARTQIEKSADVIRGHVEVGEKTANEVGEQVDAAVRTISDRQFQYKAASCVLQVGSCGILGAWGFGTKLHLPKTGFVVGTLIGTILFYPTQAKKAIDLVEQLPITSTKTPETPTTATKDNESSIYSTVLKYFKKSDNATTNNNNDINSSKDANDSQAKS